MQLHTIKLFPKTADVTLLSFLSPEGRLIGEREIDLSESSDSPPTSYANTASSPYNSAALADLGRELDEAADATVMMNMIRKGQIDGIGKGDIQGQVKFDETAES